MAHRLGIIHTIGGLVPVFEELCKEYLPGIEHFNIVDEGVLRLVLRDNGVSPLLLRRMCDNVVFAEEAGADSVLVTCSSTSPAVDVARNLVGVPVYKIDEPMIDRALETGGRIGILATARCTLAPTTDLANRRIKALGKAVEVEAVLCEGAYDAMLAGEMETHDRIIREYLGEMMSQTDVVILAQVSMARVADQLAPKDRRIPILSSPRPCFEELSKIMQ